MFKRIVIALHLAGMPVHAQTQTPAPAVFKTPLEMEIAQKLMSAKRIYVDNFGEDPINKTVQAMVIDALGGSKRFVVTENKEKADLILKGSAIEKTTEEFHALGSATSVAGAAGGHSSNISGQTNATGGTVSGSSQGGFAARKLGIADSQASTETVNDSRISVRLISTDGDVVWSTTQESKGGKFKGASADAADKIVKQLLRDLSKLEEQKTK